VLAEEPLSVEKEGKGRSREKKKKKKRKKRREKVIPTQMCSEKAAEISLVGGEREKKSLLPPSLPGRGE